MKAAIEIQNLTKEYRIMSAGRVAYRTLRESVADMMTLPCRGLHHYKKRHHSGELRLNQRRLETFKALDDISFCIRPGEVLGVIGRNGAGKSTLLKIISRITEPTAGRVVVRGRLASLLEVGTGFHPELSGRENIFMNGSILGMRRHEIRRKFDLITEFAGIERFLDTPVKRYSSGMYVRLAFAVAAFLEPEILVVDEVLAVGDAEFQKKCIAKMDEVSKTGRTVLFVSHALSSIATLCRTAIRLEHGRIVGQGRAADEVANYLMSSSRLATTPLRARTDRTGNGRARIVGVACRMPDGEPTNHIAAGDPIRIEIDYEADSKLNAPAIHIALFNECGVPVTYLSSDYTGDIHGPLASTGTLACNINELPLAPGNYLINVCLQDGREDVDHVAAASSLRISGGHFFPTGKVPNASVGQFLCKHRWDTGRIPIDESGLTTRSGH